MSVRVLETNCLHASDTLIWLDGASMPGQAAAALPAVLARIERPLQVTFEESPPDLQWLSKAGQTVLWRRPVGPVVPGLANESQRTRPALPTFPLQGRVDDPDGRFHPRRFALTVGDGTGQVLVLFPTPQATRFGNGGGVQGGLRWDGTGNPARDGQPVPWALLTLTVTLANGAVQTYQAQTDVKGDFRLALSRLPPLPDGTAHYLSSLRVQAAASAGAPGASALLPLDPTAAPQVQVRRATTNAFAGSFPLELVPGRVSVLRSFAQSHLGVRPS